MFIVLFFDEINTCDHMGLMKELICDRRLEGVPVNQNLRIVAACNPYVRHTKEMIQKLETAGLGFRVAAKATKERIGSIPLRHLVYRVQPLPPSIAAFVWDFGKIDDQAEQAYIVKIVERSISKSQLSRRLQGDILQDTLALLFKTFAASQQYMRRQKDECFFVSLRDVERAIAVFIFFFEKELLFRPPVAENERAPSLHSIVQRCNILSLAVCYYCRLNKREGYVKAITKEFKGAFALSERDFFAEVRRCQRLVINEMALGPTIAKNEALSENIFMMLVCIELLIPLFVSPPSPILSFSFHFIFFVSSHL